MIRRPSIAIIILWGFILIWAALSCGLMGQALVTDHYFGSAGGGE